jgi:hypothetical protein
MAPTLRGRPDCHFPRFFNYRTDPSAVAEMKRTNRYKDWALITALGVLTEH